MYKYISLFFEATSRQCQQIQLKKNKKKKVGERKYNNMTEIPIIFP